MDNRGAVIRHFYRLAVADFGVAHRIGKNLGVGVEQAGHVFPDGYALSPQAVGEDGGRVIGTFAAEGDWEAVSCRAARKAFRYKNICTCSKPLFYNLSRPSFCFRPIYL